MKNASMNAGSSDGTKTPHDPDEGSADTVSTEEASVSTEEASVSVPDGVHDSGIDIELKDISHEEEEEEAGEREIGNDEGLKPLFYGP